MAQCKYAMREHQISYDDGFSWISLEVIKGDLIEYQSADCPDSGSEITKWVDLDGDYICEDNRKYKKQVLYVSYDGGATWYIYYPTIYQKGEYVGIDDEFCNNKFEGHYESAATTYIDPLKIVKCNGNPTLTSGETTYYDRHYGLVSAKIGNCVTTIGNRAFASNNRLSAITIPSGITYIDDYAFNGCSGLQGILFEPFVPPMLGNYVFNNTNDCNLYVHCDRVEDYKSATDWASYASRIQPYEDCSNVQYRWVVNGYVCDGSNKYEKKLQQVSYDSGVTWYYTWAATEGNLIESGSSDCGYENQYLTLIPVSADTTFKFSRSTIYYSLDYGTTWINLPSDKTTLNVKVGEKIMFKANELTTSSNYGSGTFSASSEFNVEGNVMSLIYGDNFVGQTSLSGRNSVFITLFKNSKVVNAENMILPATSITNNCYNHMFDGCSSLIKAPKELPATSLPMGCYWAMFQGCTSLTTAPTAIHATSLGYGSCLEMFKGCNSLTTAPSLIGDNNATVESAACKYMFSACASLQTAPEILASTLGNDCYFYMFQGCTALTTAPSVLPATRVAKGSYEQMFRNCTSLTTPPSSIGTSSTTMAERCCIWMFDGCTSLKTAPQLPAMTLAESCYMYMFTNCTSLTTAPVLPAKKLEQYCYNTMFTGCTSLNTVTCLATSIGYNSTQYWLYHTAANGTFTKACNMNSWTSGIDGIPSGWTVNNLYSDTREVLVSGGYICENGNKYEKYSVQGLCNGTWQDSGAFVKGDLIESGSSDCDLKKEYLTFIPVSADTTFKFSQSGLSYSVNNGSTWKSLAANTNTPSVSAGNKILFRGTLTPSSSSPYGIGTFSSSSEFDVEGNIMSLLYNSNFSGQTSLSGKDYAFYDLFSGNTNVKNVENLVLPPTTLADYCYSNMFRGCTSLTTTPILSGITLATSCYQYMFRGCTSLTTAPSVLLATTMAHQCYYGMFYGCSGLTTAPELPATTLAYGCYGWMFYGCTSLTTAPVLSASTLATACYGNMFSNCTNLTTAPQLSATGLASSCYGAMFSNCTSLTTTPELPATTLAEYCYSSMFDGCSGLTTAPVLSATTLANYCYQQMFKGCISLTTAPVLSATTLISHCYYYMFSGCTSLNTVTCLATDISAQYCTYAWLRNVSSSGTFTKAASMTSWGSGDSGIPNGWTVQDAT